MITTVNCGQHSPFPIGCFKFNSIQKIKSNLLQKIHCTKSRTHLPIQHCYSPNPGGLLDKLLMTYNPYQHYFCDGKYIKKLTPAPILENQTLKLSSFISAKPETKSHKKIYSEERYLKHSQQLLPPNRHCTSLIYPCSKITLVEFITLKNSPSAQITAVPKCFTKLGLRSAPSTG